MGTAIEHPVPDWVRPLGTLMLRAEQQSARMSKITNDAYDGLTWSGTGCFMLYPYDNSRRQRVNSAAKYYIMNK